MGAVMVLVQTLFCFADGIPKPRAHPARLRRPAPAPALAFGWAPAMCGPSSVRYCALSALALAPVFPAAGDNEVVEQALRTLSSIVVRPQPSQSP